jgi:hypothetical protein
LSGWEIEFSNMAQFATINIGGNEQSGVNIRKTVGHGGANLLDDVMLIQALFKYIAKGLHPGAVGLGGDYKVPEVTGIMDAETYSAIGEFQIQNAARLLSHSFDGRIHPASYKGRVIRDSRKPVMCVTLMQIMATDAAVIQGHYDYPQALAQKHPELARYLDRSFFR